MLLTTSVTTFATTIATSSSHNPPFSFDQIPTYIQASNRSGLFSIPTLHNLAHQSFVVLDSDQSIEMAPINSNAENKIITAARQIKEYAATNNIIPPPSIYMYSQIDYARTLYSAGEWFEHHPQYLLHNTDGTLAKEPQGHIYDHTQAFVQQQWASTIAQPVLDSKGALDGVFIDGYRASPQGYGFLTNISDNKAKQWMEGVKNSSSLLRVMLPSKKFNIFNNPGLWSSKGADAVMIETFYLSS